MAPGVRADRAGISKLKRNRPTSVTLIGRLIILRLLQRVELPREQRQNAHARSNVIDVTELRLRPTFNERQTKGAAVGWISGELGDEGTNRRAWSEFDDFAWLGRIGAWAIVVCGKEVAIA